MPMFQNTLSVPSSYLPAYEDGTDRVFETLAYGLRGIIQKKAYNIQNAVEV
jgi:hypothetical protein